MQNQLSSPRSEKVFNEYYSSIVCRTDRMFAALFLLQWVLGIIFAAYISPMTWIGDRNQIHIHLYSAIFLGGAVAALPIFLILRHPGRVINRMVVAIAQMMFSILFIHLTGGRIETHFHIFGSLAFLAFYRDWRPLVLATAITAVDHLARGAFWPESVYGVLSASPMRALEHAGWVIFEDVFLFISIGMGLNEVRTIAEKQTKLEAVISHIEGQIKDRTSELETSHRVILEQQQALVNAAKLSTLGEMAGGVAHEINNPVAIIHLRATELKDLADDETLTKENVKNLAEKIEMTAMRISKIIKGLKSFARDNTQEPFKNASLEFILEETLDLTQERFRSHGVEIIVKRDATLKEINCRSTQISQVLLNLLNNAHDALEGKTSKQVIVQLRDQSNGISIDVTDNGPGIPEDIREKIFQPFFTTKEVGKGTGLGLSISKGIIESHGGTISVKSSDQGTTFSIYLPINPAEANAIFLRNEL